MENQPEPIPNDQPVATSKRPILIGCLLLGALMLGCCGFHGISRWRKSDVDIQFDLLKVAPLETQYQDVVAALQSEGLLRSEPTKSRDGQHFKIHLGTHGTFPWEVGFPFSVVVYASFHFDDNGRLKWVSVERYIDSF